MAELPPARRAALLALGALTTLGVGFAIGYGFTGSGHESRSLATNQAPTAPVPATAGAPEVDPSARARVPVPRPSAPVRAAEPDADPPATATPGSVPTPDVADAPDAAGTDRPPPRKVATADLPGALREVVEAQVKDDIAACLDLWSVATPGLSGRVELEFQLGPDGLEQVSVLDHSDVPMGPLSCFSSAIWDADWPAPADTDALTVTYPFLFSTAGG